VKVSQWTDAQKFNSIITKGEGTENNQKQNKLVKKYYHRVQQILQAQLDEQDHSYQYLSCISPSLQLQISQLGKKRN
jgi:hypothetical protein